MKIKELVEKYEQNERIDIAKEIETQTYISITQKRQIAELVLENCTNIVDGAVYIDSVERYILFVVAVIGAHTNLEFDYENNMVIDEYDLLCKTGMLIKIIDTFKDDYASCQEVLNMMTSDKLNESMTVEQILYSFLDGAQNVLSNTIDSFVDQFDINSLKDLPVNKEVLENLQNLLENR